MISTVIGTKLPGNGTIYVEQNLVFKAPVVFGDTVSAVVEVKEIYIDKNRAKLRTYCTNQYGDIVIDGYAIVMPPRRINAK